MCSIYTGQLASVYCIMAVGIPYVCTCFNYNFASIGEYISLYQLQRQALKSKFMENDRFVQQVMAEKASVQVQFNIQLVTFPRKKAASPPPFTGKASGAARVGEKTPV